MINKQPVRTQLRRVVIMNLLNSERRMSNRFTINTYLDITIFRQVEYKKKKLYNRKQERNRGRLTKQESYIFL